ncbi:hypothetical protein EK21DRAFT_71377 [Setomelanomma holmii]|uniref:Heterokaryon incompatibility domain-containing protein n=1 Tax=Setomelanomma holmii TaxID=210430 RepID=A0A9P4H437_9PLEO|nr:hypothetical protein EK21DRAFT_71377 [Setomelanomma holmii]
MTPNRSAATLAKPGYMKIVKTCEIARSNYNLPYAWVDTCCINKASSAELSEAINSMFRWYEEAWVCLAHLSDVTDTQLSFHQSRWYTRGWTLQELIAPKDVVFFDGDWTFRGTKQTMSTHISMITGIPEQVLDRSLDLHEIPVAQRFSWASKRETTRVEDLAYSLLGIFNINMAMLYGEGDRAFIRLQEQILSQSADMSIFLWTDLQTNQEYTGLLSPSPACFREMRQVIAEPTFTQREFYLTNRGIRMKLGIAWGDDTGLAVLPLKHSVGANGQPSGIYLRRVGLDLFARARPQDYAKVESKRFYTVFTAVKTLSSSQSTTITNRIINISFPDDICVTRVEPHGSWDHSNRIFYSTHAGAFLGYMQLSHVNHIQSYNQFAIVLCFKHGLWSAGVVDGIRWRSIRDAFYSHYKENLHELQYDSTMHDVEMGGIQIIHPEITIHMRGSLQPCIEVRIA